ncbi:flocculation protein FLO11-like [Haliotis rufescens]|uniref:flocculation protein FLO11-like n=1 Tax=Haliotis rufescens TaxID=6454 RepID=UPI00201FA7F4|nr:flocculation protein FLO11-like [Haliotis rufescens]
MLRLTLFVLFTVGIDPLVGQECSLQLVPQVPTIQVARGNNVSILCDASCYGRLSTNRLSWYDRYNQPIGMSGRVFSVRYNRGMFARLILLTVDFSETGRYTCAGLVGADVVQKHIDINVIERDFEVVEYVDAEDGPRRGDVRVDEPFLPKRRPARDADNPTNQTTKVSYTSELTTTNYSDSSEVGSGTATDPQLASETGGASTTSRSDPSTATYYSPGSTIPSPSGTPAPSSKGRTTDDQSTTTETTTAERPITSSEPLPSPEIQSTAATDIRTSEITTETGKFENGYKGRHKRDKTAFGKYGVLAFALALSVAILLLYTLILLNVIIPRCCKNKQSVSFREAPDSKHKENGPSAIDAIAMKPLAVVPCPNSPNDGFTTVDLDDKDGPKPNSNTPGQKETDAPISPTSDPGSPSKYVSTFLIGRKPSESSPLGVYLHEGKPVDSETGNEGTSDPTPEVKTGETTVSDGKEAGGEAAGRADVDTSTEVDTSTDTRDTSASSSDIGDLGVSGAKS